MGRPPPKPGDCYQVHGHVIVDLGLAGDHDWYLCHGTVWGKDVGWHGHAWLENNGTCLDLSRGREIELPQPVFYALGQCKDVRRYTPRQAGVMMFEREDYGPWEE